MKTSVRLILGAVAFAGFGVAQTSFAGAQKVIVNNGASNPVPVTVHSGVATTAADNPAFDGFTRVDGHNAVAETSDAISFAVPAGKILVLEMVTSEIRLVPGEQIQSVVLLLTTNGHPSQHWLTFTQHDVSGSPFITVSEPVRFYADGGSNVTISYTRQANGDGETTSWNASISGYLVNRPPE